MGSISLLKQPGDSAAGLDHGQAAGALGAYAEQRPVDSQVTDQLGPQQTCGAAGGVLGQYVAAQLTVRRASVVAAAEAAPGNYSSQRWITGVAYS